MAQGAGYVGRFAPSPTGALHAGSLAAALASWLDTRAHGGRWLVRIEDVDGPRCVAGVDTMILQQLAACGLFPDEPPVWQSTRDSLYANAVDTLLEAGWAYRCGCTRSEIEQDVQARDGLRERRGELVYPGTCRTGLHGKPGRATRVVAAAGSCEPFESLILEWRDRRLGSMRQNVTAEVGDFVLRRADGLWAYQLTVVVDDAAQGITHVVRGEDLANNTPRQIHLQRLLGLRTPKYLHTPLVLGIDGEKLSKQNGAQPLDLRNPLQALRAAGKALQLDANADTLSGWFAKATAQWRARWCT